MGAGAGRLVSLEQPEAVSRAIEGLLARILITDPPLQGGMGVSGKKMEGDETERRRRAQQARKAGHQPAEEEVTLGGSKQRRHLPASASHEEKLQARQAGKRPNSH